MTDTPETLPVKPGDWVEDRNVPGSVARVRAVRRTGGQVLVDLVLYDRDGTAAGRRSPVMGGPRTYEPACDYANWKRISRPGFPIELSWVPNGTGASVAAYVSGGTELPDREWIAPARRGAPARAVERTSDYDPALEAYARRMAAQILRDQAREGGDLRERATLLETEADAISPR